MSGNRTVSIVFMAFSIAMFACTFSIEMHSFVQGVSARFWPQAVLVLLFGLSLSLFVSSEGEAGVQGPSFLKTIACCLYFSGYVIGLQITGYVVATLLFQVLFLLYMGIRSRTALVLLPLITTGVMLGAFKGLLNVLLPAGVWFFKDFNSAIGI
jgi:hypothetical protein